jgi:hypothetical protein
MSKIEKLTDSQIARMAEYRDEWLKIGLCTDPADRPEAEKAIRQMYVIGGRAEPKKIVWCGSPLSAGIVRAILTDEKIGNSVWNSVLNSVRDSVLNSVRDSVWDSVLNSVRNSVGVSVWDSVRNSVGNSVGNSVRNSVGVSVWDSVRNSVENSVGVSVWNSVRNSVGNSIGDSVRNSVLNSVGNSVLNSVRDSVGNSVRNSVGNSVLNSVYGQHDAYWLAFYRYFHDVCNLKSETEKLNGLWNFAKSSGWAIPHANICLVSERHNICHCEEGRIHCDNGPAIAYPDGFSVFAIHGVRVPENIVIEPEKQTLEEIESEKNSEIKRIRIERYGWEKYLNQSGAKIVDQRINERDLQTERLFQSKDGMVRFICVDPSTGRRYSLGVPREIKTCEQAQNWMSHGLDRFAIHRS